LAAIAVVTGMLGLWGWRIVALDNGGRDWGSLVRLLLWFGWPAWPLAVWTQWRWRKQIASKRWHRHLWLPMWFSLVSIGATFTTTPPDRALLLGLPAMATLAAFSLPTLSRAVAALIDWFTLLFFSISALAIWVIWIAMQTGTPAKPAANVAKLAPEFAPSFSALALVVALAATVAWCSLVWWRASRDRAAIWKSLVLPASGATLGWLLLMTLWLPLLNHARSYGPQVQNLLRVMPDATQGCVQTYGLSRAQTAAFQYQGGLQLRPADSKLGDKNCQWLLVDASAWPAPPGIVQPSDWTPVANVLRPTDKNDQVLVFQRARPSASSTR
jgi:4-amino-4-deoxy-L-arabinose transferase-like glycosyltransferase